MFTVTMMQSMATVVSTIIEVLNLVTWVAFIFLNQLLDPMVIFNDGNLDPLLNQLWQLSRNIMNVIFALILIAAAVYTVITAKKDFVAQHLKMFVLAVVLVNFSWFIPRVILDIGNVAATVVYNLPSAIGQNNQCNIRTHTVPSGIICQDDGSPSGFLCPCVVATNVEFFVQNINNFPPFEGWNCYLGNTMCVQLKPHNDVQGAAHSYILNGLILNHGRLIGLTAPPPAAAGATISQMIMFMLQLGVVLIIHVALFFPLAAMMLAFAIRIPVIWLTVAFMPFIILQYIIPGEWAEYPKRIQSLFVKAAFLPAIVGVPLTIGFIMINAGQQAPTFQGFQQIGFRLTNNISDFYSLLWLIMSLGIIWVGVFAVLEKMDIMAWGGQAIKSTGQALGSVAVKAPLHVPLPMLGGNSILGMARSINPNNVNNALNNSPNLQAAIAQLKSGAKINPQAAKIQQSATKNVNDAAHMTKLDTHIQALTRAVSQADKDKAMQDISAHVGFTVDSSNVKQTLNQYVQDLKTAGAATGAAKTEFSKVETSAASL
jgi:hypothetical protein